MTRIPPSNIASAIPSSIDRHPLLQEVRPGLRLQVSKRICYSAEFGFCYFRIPKAANSTIVLTLAGHVGISLPDEDPRDPEARIRAAKKALGRMASVEALEESFNFTFVRNPYSRILSAYRDKATRANFAKRYGFAHRFFKRREFTFLDFLKRLEDGVLFENLHWAPQVEIIPYDLERLDKIGKVESIDRDLAEVVETIFHCPLEMQIREHRRTGADKVVKDYVGDREKAMLRRLYARDFECFYPEL